MKAGLHISAVAFISAFVLIFYGNKPVFPELQNALRHIPGSLKGTPAEGEVLQSGTALAQCYQKNSYALIWHDSGFRLLKHGEVLIQRIEATFWEGMDSSDYHCSAIKALLNNIKKGTAENRRDIAIADILLTDAFITYASHHYAGRIHSASFNSSWKQHTGQINPIDSLKKLEQGHSMQEVLDAFACPYAPYRQLQKMLQQYYQQGVLSDTATTCIKLIRLNMEKWRWLQRTCSDTYIMANVTDFTLKGMSDGSEVLQMRTIAGKFQQPTPLFEARLAYLTINPWWEIPSSIAKKEILPEVKRDIAYLEKHCIKVYDGNVEVEAQGISWDTITPSNFKYRFRQMPGPWNALGQLKFIFPNKYNIYFHDTPSPELFNEEVRTFSHGCIRIEKPFELAAWLLGKDIGEIKDMVATGKEITLEIPSSPIVFVCYWTAWVGPDGQLCSAPDIYQYDKQLEALWDE